MSHRVTYTTEQVRAIDLNNKDVAMINGRWREVADVHADPDTAREFYGTPTVARFVGQDGEDGLVGQVLVRHLLTGPNSSGGVDDQFVLLDSVALITVQVANINAGPVGEY